MERKLDEELQRLAAEVQRQVEENKRFLEHCFDERPVGADAEDVEDAVVDNEEESEEPFEEL